MNNNRRSLDPLMAVRAALEVGDAVGYVSGLDVASPTGQEIDELEPNEAIATVWDIHDWGVRCVAENEKNLLLINWENISPPF